MLFPALRLGYAVLPSELLPHFEAAQSLTAVSQVEAGLQTEGLLCKGIDAGSAAAAAEKLGVYVTPLDRSLSRGSH